ncbi:hypothetical protein L596_014479 [Steinernema carpocapsae]|uniref:Uncharacterized protein n=1 Tax=Steinernema carpocapsae TaxID=34508 RepID=A0A4U5NC25_STECR|nr:hypothetical protein L596_014479 [Steinernema carpocapsae]
MLGASGFSKTTLRNRLVFVINSSESKLHCVVSKLTSLYFPKPKIRCRGNQSLKYHKPPLFAAVLISIRLNLGTFPISAPQRLPSDFSIKATAPRVNPRSSSALKPLFRSPHESVDRENLSAKSSVTAPPHINVQPPSSSASSPLPRPRLPSLIVCSTAAEVVKPQKYFCRFACTAAANSPAQTGRSIRLSVAPSVGGRLATTLKTTPKRRCLSIKRLERPILRSLPSRGVSATLHSRLHRRND